MTESQLSVGSEAPNFDLTSTEDVLLMLCDEVPRTAVVLYVFRELDDEADADLKRLASEAPKWSEQGVRILAMAPVKVAQLKQLQTDLQLPFPLLEDDRDFCARYGVSEETEPRRLVLIDRQNNVHWFSERWQGLGAALAQLKNSRPERQSKLINYPGKVVNRLVEWWVT